MDFKYLLFLLLVLFIFLVLQTGQVGNVNNGSTASFSGFLKGINSFITNIVIPPKPSSCNISFQCVPGGGGDPCKSNKNCDKYRMKLGTECVADAVRKMVLCKKYESPDATKACDNVDDCSYYSHNVCYDGKCLEYMGKGMDECFNNSDCKKKYSKCSIVRKPGGRGLYVMQCLQEEGFGQSNCKQDSDCLKKGSNDY